MPTSSGPDVREPDRHAHPSLVLFGNECHIITTRRPIGGSLMPDVLRERLLAGERGSESCRGVREGVKSQRS